MCDGRLQTARNCVARFGQRTRATRQNLARVSALQTAGAQVWHTPKKACHTFLTSDLVPTFSGAMQVVVFETR